MRGAKWLSLGGIAASLAAVYACSSSPPAAPYPDVTSFCTALASAECQVIPNACGNSPSQTDCESTETAACQAEAAALTSGAPARTYTQANAKACIDAANKLYGGTATDPRISGTDLDNLATTCDAVFAGTSPDNTGTCQVDADCEDTSAVCTFIPATAATGYCGKPNSVSAGGSCASPGDQCQGSTYCTGTPPASTCTARLPNGAACTVNAECQGHCVSGTCAALGGIGAPCTTVEDCDESQAPAGAFCDPSRDNTCQNGETFDQGEPECSDFGFGATPSGTGSSSSSSSSSSGSSSGSSSSSSSSSGSSSGVFDSGTD